MKWSVAFPVPRFVEWVSQKLICTANLLLTLQNIEMSIVGTAVPGLGTSRRRQFRLHVAQSRGFLGNLLSFPFLAIKFPHN